MEAKHIQVGEGGSWEVGSGLFLGEGFLSVQAKKVCKRGNELHCIHMHATGQLALVGQSHENKTVDALLGWGQE